MARPTKLTKDVEKRICDALRAGNTRAAAAAYGGVSVAGFYGWMKSGETAKTGEFLEFLDAVKRAEAECEVQSVAQIRKAASDGTWQAAAWWLERRRPDDWKLRSETALVGEKGGPLEIILREVNQPHAEN